MIRALALILMCFVSACGSDSPSPPAPSPSSNIAGVWRGTGTTIAVFGGECFANSFASIVGSTGTISAAVTQTGSNVSATVLSPSSGANCTYTGTMGQTALQMTGTGCSASDLIGARCPNGAIRDIRLQTNSLTATVTGSSMSGQQGETYNILIGGTTTGVGTVSITSNFSMTKQ